MCGIVGYIGARNAAPVLLEGLRKLEYRGYDSAGIALLSEGEISISKVTGRVENLCEMTGNGKNVPGNLGIGHTRWATHGAPTDTNAHPHLSNDGIFAVVHNGIIENYMDLQEELMKDGYRFESETDTEVIVHLLEKYYSGDLKRAVMMAAARLQGSYALGIVCTKEPEKIYVVREASPLILGVGIGENFFASDVTALVANTRNAIYLDDGEFAELRKDSIQVYDPTGRAVKKAITRITWDVKAAEKGGYEHFMLKEIIEQPGAVEATISPRIQNGEVVLDDVKFSEEEIKSINKIVITACGSAYYAGCAGKKSIESLCRIPVQVELASELRYDDPLIDEHTLLIVVSQSGETADTIAAMKECKRRGARTLAIVNVVSSTIAKLADDTIYTWAGPEIAVATTKGYTTQVAVLYLFSVFAARKAGKISDEENKKLIQKIKTLPNLMQQALDMNSGIAKLAGKYANSESMFFIGRNTDYAVALEGALKLKEISYIHAECYAAGELKHGTIALISEHQPVVAICCNGNITEKTMSNIVEVKARGAEVLTVAVKGDRRVVSLADDMIFIPSVDAIFSAIVIVVPLQLFAYYIAKEKNCDIDKPKNLAKSVTVE